MDLTFLDPFGRALISFIELFVSLSTLTSAVSLFAAVVATWTMQVTTRDAATFVDLCHGRSTPQTQMALAQRVALALISLFLVLNAVTPFITPDPPWLANLPLVIAITLFLLAFGIAHQRVAQSGAKKPAPHLRL